MSRNLLAIAGFLPVLFIVAICGADLLNSKVAGEAPSVNQRREVDLRRSGII